MKKIATLSSRIALLLALVSLAAASASAQYQRVVLIEEFTSVTCVPCADATPVVNRIINDHRGSVVSARFHMNIPYKGDPWFVLDSADIQARKAYYNILAIPAARVDGVTAAPTNENDIRPRVESDLGDQSPIKLDVTHEIVGDQVNVTVKATADADGLTSGKTLHVVLVESQIHDDRFKQKPPYNGESDFYDVVRKLLPDGDGEPIELAANASKTLHYTATAGSDWQTGHIYAIAFVQDDFDKSVAQTGASSPTAGINEPAKLAGYSFEPIMPNPAVNTAQVEYAIAQREQVRIALFNTAGEQLRTIDEGARELGSHHAQIDLAGMPSGIYTVTIEAGKYRATRQLVVAR
jgi:hypothetical protein